MLCAAIARAEGGDVRPDGAERFSASTAVQVTGEVRSLTCTARAHGLPQRID